MLQKERGWLWLRREQAPFSGLEKQHSDLDRTMQFLGAGEGLQGPGRHFWGVMAPIATYFICPLYALVSAALLKEAS